MKYAVVSDDDTQPFGTSDFCLATTLYCLGFQIKSVDRVNPKRIVFNFYGSEEITQTISDYWNDEITVTPQAFYFAQKQIKSILYQ